MSESAPQRSIWVLVTTVVCCAAMGAVIAMAIRGRKDPAAAEPWVDTTKNKRWIPPTGPRNPCGEIDPDHPAEIEVQVGARGLDFGVTRQGETATQEIPFRSTGTGPLCIYELKSGCGCFQAKLKDPEKRRYEPGESGAVVVTLNTAGLIGRIRKSVRIHCNSLKNPSPRTYCVVDISRGLISSRTVLYFHSVAPNTASTAEVELKSPLDEGDWTVTKVEGTAKRTDGSVVPYTFALVDQKDPKFRKRRVLITHPGLPATGVWLDNLILHTTHPTRPQVNIQARFQVVDRILVDATRVRLGHVHVGEASKPAVVRVRAGQPTVKFDLKRAYVTASRARPATGQGVGFLAKTGRDDRGWFVEVRYDGRERRPEDARDQPALLQGDLVIHTSDAVQRTLRVPVSATLVSK